MDTLLGVSPENPREQRTPLRPDQHQELLALARRLNTDGAGEPALPVSALLRVAVDLLLGAADNLPVEDINTEAGLRAAALLALARYDTSERAPERRLGDETDELRRHALKLGEHARAMPNTADLAHQMSGLTQALDECVLELARTRHVLGR